MLETTRLKERHTAEFLGDALNTCFEKWGILNKVAVIVSDNGANIKKAVRDCLLLEHHPCAAHTLNLSVNDGIKQNEELLEIINKCRKIVGFFKSSVLASDQLEKNQISAGTTILRPKQDVPTRWNSQLYMLRRLIEIKLTMTQTLNDLSKIHLELSNEEWSIINDAVQILDPFELITKELSGEKFVTSSLIIPLIEGCIFALNLLKPVTETGNSLKNNFVDKIIPERFNFIYEKKNLIMATALDPRFKLNGFDKESHKMLARRYLKDELDKILENIPPNSETSSTSDLNVTQSTSTIWQHLEQKRIQHNTTATVNLTSERILERYFEMRLEERNVDPIFWWDEKKLHLPELYKLSKQVLIIPATSVPSERIFSKAGMLCNDKRNRLTPKHVNEILFLNFNL